MTKAPALIKGFLGIPFSFSNCVKELKGSPEGSTSTRFQILLPCFLANARLKTLEILCIENFSSLLPNEYH